ncbi:MAG: hypothetical protein JHC95_04175 [Solirubrobacteraceae bacterium]|nr:hypothetical protein [Solirubrobacteraceae bacterium]
MSDLVGLCGQSCPSHEDVLLALDEALGTDAVDQAPARIAALAAGLPEHDAIGHDPVHELAVVAGLLRDEFVVDGDGSLAMSEVLADGGGHPLAIAAAVVCAAQRRGLPIDLVGNGERVWLAHTGGETPYVVDPAGAQSAFDARSLGVDLHWRCAHEVAGLVLDRVIDRAERCGDLGTAVRGAELRGALRMDDEAARSHGTEVQRLRARLN